MSITVHRNNTFLWKLMEKHGYDNDDSVQSNMKRALKKEIIERHEKSFSGICKVQKITKPNPDAKRPLWSTYILDPTAKNGLKRVQAKTEEAFFQKLAEVYIDNYIDKELPSFLSFWDSYYTKRSNTNIKPDTLKKDREAYERFIEPSRLFSKPIDQITTRDLQRWLDYTMDTITMRKQEFYTSRHIIKEIFEIAMDEKLMNQNPAGGLKRVKPFRNPKDNNDVSRRFTEEQYHMLNNYFWVKFYETKDSHALAFLFNMGLGLRSGELVALKWEDIILEDGDIKLYVHRKESKNYVKNDSTGTIQSGYIITEHCKHGSDRKLTLDQSLLDILELQKSLGYESEYIFGNGKRMTSRQLAYQYEDACEKLNIPVRRNHAMRRTVATLLKRKGISLTFIQHLLGHDNVKMTLDYIGDVDDTRDERKTASELLGLNHQESLSKKTA